MKLVECVPNFSEGRNKATIDAISDAIKSVPGVLLMDVDPGAATNRTVYTLAGSPEDVLEAAFRAIKRGTELIDMTAHKGEHSRQGACDVCPFVPISEITMAECVELANRLGKRVGEELHIPVYLYAEAAKRPERKRLPDIRAGEYEALAEKLGKPEWKPDLGPAKFNARSGAMVTGARGFLIAFNVNLNTTSTRLAKEIAFAIRESGRLMRDEKGEKVIGPDGIAKRVAGIFKNLQGTGWYIPEYGRAQVTINILDTETAPVHKVYDACCELASKLGLRVTGSEIVGMVPKQVLTDAGVYFLKKQGASLGVSEEELIDIAIMSLGLRDVSPFDPKKKIIEEQFMTTTPLADLTVKGFAKELASNSPAPGGGSVAALAGAMSAGLSAMVASLTYEKKGYENVREQMQSVGVEAHSIMKEQLAAIDDDTRAFNKVMDCFGMPKETDEQKAARKNAIQEATKNATLEPFKVLERSIPSLKLALDAAKHGNQNSLSDAGVAGLMADSAAWGAYYNVLINLQGINDKAWADDIRAKAEKLIDEVEEKAAEVKSLLLEKLG